mmetsp:Transcript_32031/g.51444  ORF Transcript_32031/g.51444 Transcript_32031/m.51444 type:complete len:108 (+) Transcript_32031:72-395(+)
MSKDGGPIHHKKMPPKMHPKMHQQLTSTMQKTQTTSFVHISSLRKIAPDTEDADNEVILSQLQMTLIEPMDIEVVEFEAMDIEVENAELHVVDIEGVHAETVKLQTC